MASTVWRGFVTFGLISIPVRLFRAARPERISLRRVQRVPRGPERAAASDDGDDDADRMRPKKYSPPRGAARLHSTVSISRLQQVPKAKPGRLLPRFRRLFMSRHPNFVP